MASTEKIPVSVGILTLNAARLLPGALDSVAQFDDVYICDGGSTDDTLKIARERGIRVERQSETDYGNTQIQHFAEACNHCARFARHEWYIRLDADERLTPEVAEEMRSIAESPNPQARVYKLPRLYVWKDKIVNDSITYPNNQARFYHRAAVKGFEKVSHERLVPKDGESVGITKQPMLVVLMDDYFTEKRMQRAMEWDRLQYENQLTVGSWLHGLAHTAYVMTLFGFRFLRVHLISRGHTLPVAYDWWRYRYMAKANILATRMLVRKLFRTSTPTSTPSV